MSAAGQCLASLASPAAQVSPGRPLARPAASIVPVLASMFHRAGAGRRPDVTGGAGGAGGTGAALGPRRTVGGPRRTATGPPG